jgi:hypothetical protein
MAAPAGVELAKQPVLVDHLVDRAKARWGAFLNNEKSRVDRARRVIERYHQVVLAIIARQPGKARGIPRFRDGRLWCGIIPTSGRCGRFLRCAERLGAGRTSPAPCSASRVTV